MLRRDPERCCPDTTRRRMVRPLTARQARRTASRLEAGLFQAAMMPTAAVSISLSGPVRKRLPLTDSEDGRRRRVGAAEQQRGHRHGIRGQVHQLISRQGLRALSTGDGVLLRLLSPPASGSDCWRSGIRYPVKVLVGVRGGVLVEVRGGPVSCASSRGEPVVADST